MKFPSVVREKTTTTLKIYTSNDLSSVLLFPLEFPLKQIGSEILSFQQAQDILIDIYYNCIWAHM